MENAARLIAVERDTEGIRLAALEMLTEALGFEDRKRTERIAAQSDPEAVLAAAAPKREFACGYYVWATYLFGLEAQIQAGIHTELNAADAKGLLALRQAREEFERKHPRCRSGCGRLVKNEWDQMCAECSAAHPTSDQSWQPMKGA